MKGKEILKLLWGYIEQHKKSIILFCLFTIIFMIVFSLYHISLDPIGYAILLCFFITAVFFVIDFIHFYLRHKQMEEMQFKIMYHMHELPKPRNITEQDYTALLEVVFQNKLQNISAYDNEKSEMIEYYTLWAHQIKTPIAAMRLLLQEEESEENKDLQAELFKVEQYVEMVLSYLRLDSSHSDYVIKEYSLDRIVKQAIRKYAPLFIRKKIRLHMQPLHCTVLTDEKWLGFVIEQILSNALKYTHRGEINIYMQGEKSLVIQDTGIGIAKEDLPRICEKGYTGYNGRVDKKASGIGLYLCKRILKKLSHTLTIESAAGKGTKTIIGLEQMEIVHE